MKLSTQQIENNEIEYFESAFLCVNQYLTDLMVLSNRDFLKWLTQLNTTRRYLNEGEINEAYRTELLYSLKEVQFQLQYHDILEQKTQHIIEINRAVPEIICARNKKNFYVRLSKAYIGMINSMYEQYIESSMEMRRIMGDLYKEANLTEKLGRKLADIEEIANTYRHKKTMIISTLENMICNVTPIAANVLCSPENVKQIRDFLSTKSERVIFDLEFGEEAQEESLEAELF